MAKKKKAVMAEEREYFIHGMTDADGHVTVPGCVRNGVPEAVAEQIYDEMTDGVPYWFDPDGITLYKKTFDGNEEIWSGTYEDAGTFEGDPDWQEKLDSFFEKELGIKADEWEVG
jgi:hypothetical protein